MDKVQVRRKIYFHRPHKKRNSLARRNQHLETLNTVARTASQTLELDALLGHTLDEVLRLTSVDCGAIFLWEENLGDLKLMVCHGLSEEAAHMATRMGLLDTSCGGVVEKGQLVIVPDLSGYRGRRASILKRSRVTTIVHIPLIAKGNTLGSLCIGTYQKREFDCEDQILFTAIGNQLAIAIENACLYAEVQQKERLRSELFRKAINAQEEERKRIARDLHDDTSQSLTALLYAVEVGQEMNDLAEIKNHLANMQELTQRTLDGVHKVIFDMRPSMLDHLGLVPALRWFAKTRLEPKGVRVTIEEETVTRRLPPEMETLLFRVVQEAITNIARHAMAHNVAIIINMSDESIMIDVEDDGIGFDMDEVDIAADNGRGLGLLGMQERMQLMGGELLVDSARGYGTQIHIEAPILGEKQVSYA